MSNYPYSQQPPPNYQQPYYPQYQDPRGPAKRASILMFVIGGLGLICGGCLLLAGAVVPWNEMNTPEMRQAKELIESTGMSLQVYFAAVGVVAFVGAALFVILAVFVRRGGFGAVVSAIVLTALCLLLLVVGLIYNLAVSAKTGHPNPGGICGAVVPIALCALLLTWLFQAAKNSSLVSQQTQYQQQYWQYQQQQQQQYYQQGAYGAPQGQPMPPAVPPMPPPPRFDQQEQDPDAPPPAQG